MAEDEEMQRALELSAQQHMATCTTLAFDGETRHARRDLGAPCRQHWPGPWQARQGVVIQADTLNQFSHHWAPIIRETGAPSSICGYMAVANALALRRLMPSSGVWTRGQLDKLLQQLRTLEAMEAEVCSAMRFIAERRAAWIADHEDVFKTEMDRRKYLSAWVANFEISDFLTGPGSLLESPSVFFARYNQWPERPVATHEEWARLAEEERFGGQQGAAGGATQYAEGDSVFILERFAPERRLHSPAEFLDSWAIESRPPSVPAIFVTDLNGHFVACVAVHMREVGENEVPAVIVFNTTGTRYLDRPTCAFVFDLTYAPEPSASEDGILCALHPHALRPCASATNSCDICNSIGTAHRCGAGCDWDLCARCFSDNAGDQPPADEAAIASITSMGFSESEARRAIAQTGGSVELALEVLLR